MREVDKNKFNKRPNSSFQANYIDCESKQKSKSKQHTKNIQAVCQNLAYTIGFLKAELNDARNKRDEQR